MTRHGFALLSVLWVVVALGTVAGGALAVARLGANASSNRILLLRSRWARDACGEILLGRYAEQRSPQPLDTVDLGQRLWCEASIERPLSRVDLNLAPAAVLRAVLGSDSLTDALLDWRDPDDLERENGAERAWYWVARRRGPRNGALADVGELRWIRGFEQMPAARLESLFTVHGSAQLDVSGAPAELLATLPGIGPEAVELILRRRASANPIASIEELASLLSSRSRELLLPRHEDLIRQAVFTPSRFLAVVTGGVRGTQITSRVRLTLVPAGGRLAVVRQEAE